MLLKEIVSSAKTGWGDSNNPADYGSGGKDVDSARRFVMRGRVPDVPHPFEIEFKRAGNSSDWNIQVSYVDGNDELRKWGVIDDAYNGPQSQRIAAFVQKGVREFLNSAVGDSVESVIWRTMTDKQVERDSAEADRYAKIMDFVMGKIAGSREGWTTSQKGKNTFIASGPAREEGSGAKDAKEIEKRQRRGTESMKAKGREDRLNKKIAAMRGKERGARRFEDESSSAV